MDGLVSVYDVIAAVKGCSSTVASNVYLRLLREGRVPEFPKFRFIPEVGTKRGGSRLPTPVADVRGIVKLIFALPGKYTFRRECADLYMRFIGGKPELIDEVLHWKRPENARPNVGIPDLPRRKWRSLWKPSRPTSGRPRRVWSQSTT